MIAQESLLQEDHTSHTFPPPEPCLSETIPPTIYSPGVADSLRFYFLSQCKEINFLVIISGPLGH